MGEKKSKILAIISKLILPTSLSIALYANVQNKIRDSDIYSNQANVVIFSFIGLFYFIFILEWIRLHKIKKNNSKDEDRGYSYLAAILVIFLLSLMITNYLFKP